MPTDQITTYYGCTFLQDVPGVAKKGEKVDSIDVDVLDCEEMRINRTSKDGVTTSQEVSIGFSLYAPRAASSRWGPPSRKPSQSSGLKRVHVSHPATTDQYDELGMFTWEEFQDIDIDVNEYTDCTFKVDIKGVAKMGEKARLIIVNHQDKTMAIHKDGKVYNINIGYYCYDMTVSKDDDDTDME